MKLSQLRSTALVSVWTLLSRIMGFVRDVLLASWFGAGAGMDAFLVAFKIPNFLRRLFAEGALAQAFVPVLAQAREESGDVGVRELTARVFGLLAFCLALLSLLAIALSPWLVMLFAPGFDDQDGRLTLAAALLKITFPYLMLISLVALVSSVLQTYERFSWPAFAPVLLNLSLISGGWLGLRYLEQPLFGLAWGVLAAGLAQLVLVAIPLRRLRLLPRPQLKFSDARVRRVLVLMAPIAFGSSVAQLALLIDSILASLLAVGSVSWLYFADRLMELPLGVFAIAIATVLLPGLSRAHAQGNAQQFAAELRWALQVTAFIVVPAAVALLILALPLVSTLFQYQAFASHDAQMTARALRAYALGLLGFSFVKILAPAFFARHDTRTPVRIGIRALLVGVCFNLTAVGYLLNQNISGGHWVLALGTSLTACLNAFWLWRALPPGIRSGALPQVGLAVLAGSLVMGLLLQGLHPGDAFWLAATAGERVTALAGLIGAGLLCYAAMLLLCGIRPRDLRPRKLVE